MKANKRYLMNGISRSRAFLLMLLAFSFSAIVAKAEGSIQVNPRGVGATRAYLEHKEKGKFTGGIARTNRILFIAKRGETVALATSVDKSYMTQNVDIIVKYLQDGRSWSIDIKGEHDGAATSDKYEGYIAKPINEEAGPWYPMTGEQGDKYKPYLFKVPYEGVYEVEFIGKDEPISSGNQNSPADPVEADWTDAGQYENVAAWDISVFDVNDKLVNGRVFASYLAIIIGNQTGKHFSNLYVLTQDGYLYSMDIKGFEPGGFILYADNVGLIDDGNGQTLNRNGMSNQASLVPINGGVVTVQPDLDAKDDILTHRIFFNEPDPNIEFMHGGFPVSPQPIASIINCNFIGNTNQEDKYGNADESMGGVFSVELDRRSTYEIIIDCNNDGKFDNSIDKEGGYSDRVMTAAGCVGVNYLSWNGLDGNGKPLPIGEYAIQVRTHAGDFHFPMGDVENNPEGIEIKLLNALAYQSTGKDDDKQYRAWYDARKYTTHNKTIVNPEGTYAPKPLYVDMDYSTNDDISKGGFMKFSNNYGDKKIVDIWSYVVNDGRSVTQSTITLSPKGSNNYAFISGTTYFEKTRNGKYDNGERGVDGVMLTLCDASRNPILRDGNPISMKSNNGGRFAFDNIPLTGTSTTYWIKVDKGMDNGEVYSLTETTTPIVQNLNYRKVVVTRFDNFKVDIFGWGGNDVSVKAAITQNRIYTGHEQTLTVTLKNEVADAKVNNVVVTIDQTQLTAENILEGNIDYEIVGDKLEDETFANGIWTVPTMSGGEVRKLILKFIPIKEAASVSHAVRANINSNNNVETNTTNNKATVTYEVIKSTAGSIVYKANNGGTGDDYIVDIPTIQVPGTNAVLKSLSATGIKAKGCMTFMGWGVNDPLKVTNLAGENIKESLVGAALPVYAIWQGDETKYHVRHLEILSDGTKTDSNVKDEDIYDDKRVGDVVVVEQALIPGYQYITKDEPLTLECEGDNIYNIYYQFNIVLPVAVKDLVYDGTAHELVTEITPEDGVTFKYSLDGGSYSKTLPKATEAGDHIVKLQVFSESTKVHEVEFTVTIAQKELGLTWTGSTFTYDTQAHAPVATLTGIIGTDDVKAEVSGAQINVGTGYEATASLSGGKASNYKLPDEVTTTFDITRATPSMTAPVAVSGLVYNALAQTLVTAGTSPTGTTIQYSLTGTDDWSPILPTGTDAGTYKVYYKLDGGANYNDIDVSLTPVTVTIAKAQLTLSVSMESWVYGAEAKTPVLSGYEGDGAQTIEYFTDAACSQKTAVANGASSSGQIPSNFGVYYVKWSVAETANYKSASATTSFEITKATATVTPPTALTLTYNGANQTLIEAGTTTGGDLEYSLDGTSWVTTLPKGKAAKTYTVYYMVSGGANYNDVAKESLSVTIAQKELTLTWGETTLPYTGLAQIPTVEISGVEGSDDVQVTAATAKAEVGTGYTATASISGAAAANYKLPSVVTKSFNITAIDPVLTKAPTAKTLTYNATAQNLVESGTATGGELMYSLNGTSWSASIPQGTEANSYTVYYKIAGDANHNSTEVEGPINVTIDQKTIDVVWGDTNFGYDGQAHTPTATLSGVETVDKSYVSLSIEGSGTAADTYTATATLQGTKSANYQLSTATKTTQFSIGKTTPTVTAPTVATSLVYNGTDQALLATAGSTNGGTLKYSIDGESWTTTIPQAKAAQNYTVYYKVEGNSNYADVAAKTLNVAIAQKQLTIDWGTKTFVYDGSAHKPSPTVAGVETGDEVEVTVDGEQINVGSSYPTNVTLSGADASNYKFAAGADQTTFDITKATITITAPTAKSLTYNSEEQTLVMPATISAGTIEYSINNGTTWSEAVPTAINAGTYNVYYKVTGGANYNDIVKSGPIVVTIDKKELTLNWENTLFVYDGTSKVPTALLSGKYGTDEVGVTVTGEHTDAGIYTATASSLTGAAAANYKLPTTNTVSFEIKKATPAVTMPVAASDLVYDGTMQDLIATAATTTGGTLKYSLDGSTWMTTIPQAKDADTYTVYYKVDGNNNYNELTGGNVSAAIAQKELTLTWGSTTSFIYDGTPKKPTLDFAGKAGTDDVTVTVSGEQTNKGSYTAKAVLDGTASANYKLPADIYLTFTITEANPTVTAPVANTLTYNGTAQNLVTAGFCATGTIYYSTDGIDGWSDMIPTGKDAGSEYVVYYKVETTDDNYVGVASTGPISVTIAKKTIGIEWSNTSFVYDGNPHKPTATATGKEGTDNVTVVVTGDQTESGSGYVATAVSIEGADVDNYELPATGLTTIFSIGRKQIAKPAIDLTQTFTYTGSEQTYSVPGPSDASGYTISGNKGTDAGSYMVVIKLGDNYSWTDESRDDIEQEWSIARAEVTLPSAVTSTFTYDGTVKDLEVTENDKYTIGTENATATNAGTYDRVVTLKDNVNYVWTDGTDASKTITFTINKAKVDLPTAPTTHFIYDGTEYVFEVNPNSNYTVAPSNASAIETGDYPRTISLNDTENYEWVDGTTEDKTIVFKIGTGIIEEPTIQTEYTYTGSTIVFLTGSEYDIINGEGKDAGKYTVKVTPKSGFTWEGGSVAQLTYEVEILPAKVDKPTFVQTEFVWNGSEYNFNVAENEGYTITGETKGTEIADYPVTITLKSNYIWSDDTSADINETFKIKHIVINVPAADETEFTYDGNDKTYNIPDNDAYDVVNNIQEYAGKYIVSVSLKDDVHYIWNDNTNDTKMYDFIIAKIPVPVPVPEYTSFIFDGSAKTFAIPQDELGRYVIGDENATGTLVGTYDRTVILCDFVNYAWADGFAEATRTITFTITLGSVEKPTVEAEHTYTGQPITLVPENDAYTVTDGVQTDAGEYDVVLTLNEGYTWIGGSADPEIIHVTINPAQVAKPEVTVTDFTYDGTEFDFNIVENSGYTIEGVTKGTEPDEYTVKVTPKSNYAWSDGSGSVTETYKFYINKIQVAVPVKDETEFTYDGNEKTYNIPASIAYTVTGNVQTGAGKHTVTVSLNDVAHYVWSDGKSEDKTYDFNIAKEKVEVPVVADDAFAYDGTEKLFVVPADPENRYKVGATNASATEVGVYTRTVALTDKNNYEWATGTTEDLTYTFTITDGTVDEPVVEATYTYTGAPIVFVQPSSLYSVVDGIQTNVGEYTVYVTLNSGYTWSSGGTDTKTYKVSIVPMPIEKPELVSGKYTYNGETHVFDIPVGPYEITGDTEGKNAGEYTLSLVPDANHIWSDNSREELTITNVIDKAIIAIPVAPQTTFIYDGTEKKFEIPTGEGYVVGEENASGTESKTYDRVVSLTDKDNTLWSDGTAEDIVITFTIGDGTVEVPTVGEFTYTGEPITLIPEKSEYKVEGGVQTNAGKYEVKLTLTAGFKWSDGTNDSKIVVVTINPAKVDKPVVTSVSYPYDGESHGIKIAENVAYEISGDMEAIEPGMYTVTVTLKPNYIWSDGSDEALTYSFVIEEKEEPENPEKPEMERLGASYIKLMWDDVLVVDNAGNLFISYQWYRDGAIINGANEQFYCERGGVNGSYEVIVKTTDGKEYIIGPAVYKLQTTALNVTVNPNPIHTGETFSIVVDGLSETEMQNAVVRIYSLSSTVVFSSEKVEHINQVVLPSSGAHVVSVVSGNKKATVKILVE